MAPKRWPRVKLSAAPTHAEEMYDPDVYGKALPAQFVVGHE